MVWKNPLPLKLIVTDDSESFSEMPAGSTGLPVAPHPGAYSAVRRFDVHEGVDLYAPHGMVVSAVEDGVVVDIEIFTGPAVETPWWRETYAMTVEGASGRVVYGEIRPEVEVGGQVKAGDRLGTVVQVLRKDKGRPMAMLHLELYVNGRLVDPTDFLRDAQ
jgi:murein DD-endopeptidase MepM/ murein hydrolase activator NlpD